MNLGLQLVLGGLRKRAFVPGVEGQGTLVAMPEPFSGYSQVDGTGIVVDGLNYDFEPDGKQAPFAFKCWPTIRVAGTVRFSSGAIRPKLHCHTTYKITYQNGDPVPHANELVNKYTNEAVDPLTDIGNVGCFMLRDPGAYRLTVSVYLATSTGQARVQTVSHDFTIAVNTGTKVFFDATNGNTANDGKDPLGLELTNATYTHATGVIAETGAGVGLTLDTIPYKLNSKNWLFVNGFGLVYLSAATDDTLTVHPDFRDVIGSDQTGLTSSTGPKAASNFAAAQLNSSTFNNTMYMLSGMNTDVYDKTNELVVTSCLGTVGVVGYGGKPRVTFSSGGHTNYVYNMDQAFSNTNSPDQIVASNVIFDGQETVGGYGGSMDSGATLSPVKWVNDRITISKHSRPSSLFQAESGGTRQQLYFYSFSSYWDNRRVNIETFSPTASGLTAGSSTIQVSTAIPSNVQQSCFFKITEGSTTEYGYIDSWTGDTFTLDYYRETDTSTLVNSFTSAAVITISNKKTINVGLNNADGVGIKGDGYIGDADLPTYDHFLYPKYYGDNQYVCYCYTESEVGGDNRNGFMFNHNGQDASDTNVDNLNVSFNYIAPNSCQGFSEGSGGVNSVTSGTFTNMYLYGNAGSPNKFQIYTMTVVSLFAKSNRFWRSEDWDYIGVLNFDIWASNELWVNYDWYVGAEENYGYNMPLHYNALNPDEGLYGIKNLDMYNNKVWTLGNNLALITAFPADGTQIYNSNTFYSPLDADGNNISVSGSTVSLSSFNTTAGYTNNQDNPGWNDPANGDFSTTPEPQSLILGGGTKYASMSGFDLASADAVAGGDDFTMSLSFRVDSLSFVSLLGALSPSANRIRVDNATTISVANGAETNTFTIPDSVSLSTNTWHLLEFSRTSNSLSMRMDGGSWTAGQASTLSLGFDQIARRGTTVQTANIEVQNLTLVNTTDSWTIGYNIDGGEVPTPPDTSVTVAADTSINTVDSHAIIYYNIDSADWV